MRRPLAFVALAVLAGVVLAATVFREEVAYAAQAVNATIVGPLDGGGNIKVHEQGTANVSVTNGSLSVTPQVATKDFQTIMNASGPTGGDQTVTFPTIDASLITLTSMQGAGVVEISNGSDLVLVYRTADGDVVLPLTQPLSVTELFIDCNLSCSALVNVVGT